MCDNILCWNKMRLTSLVRLGSEEVEKNSVLVVCSLIAEWTIMLSQVETVIENSGLFDFSAIRLAAEKNWMEAPAVGRFRILALLTIWLVQLAVPGAIASYSIGVGRADATGPAAEIVFVSIARKYHVRTSISHRNYNMLVLQDARYWRANLYLCARH